MVDCLPLRGPGGWMFPVMPPVVRIRASRAQKRYSQLLPAGRRSKALLLPRTLVQQLCRYMLRRDGLNVESGSCSGQVLSEGLRFRVVALASLPTCGFDPCREREAPCDRWLWRAGALARTGEWSRPSDVRVAFCMLDGVVVASFSY